jgi:eukaryotic-like serine/threonine-protein kinase
MASATERPAPRRRLSLAIRIFLLLAALLSVAVGAAVFISQQQGARIAERGVQRTLDASAALQDELAGRQLEEVQLKIQLIAADADFVKYIADAQVDRLGFDGAADARSIQDLLGERQVAFGFDLGLVLDADGEVLARSDQLEALQQSLADDPFVRAALDPPQPLSGYWRMGDALYQAAIWPLAQGSDLVGYLILANRVDGAIAERIGRASEADIAFLLPREGGIEAVGSSLDDAHSAALRDALAADAGGLASAVRDGRAERRIELTLVGTQWIGRLRPLDSEGGPEIGAALQLTSADRAAAGYREILKAVALAGLLVLIVGLPLSLLLAKASLRPLRQMADAAKAAVAGDYNARIDVGGRDELAELAGAFESLLSDLRGERDIESYVTQLSRLLPDAAEEAAQVLAEQRVAAASAEPERALRLVVGIEHRPLASAIDLHAPSEAVLEIDAWSQRLAQRAAQFGGRIVMVNGPRVLAAFEDGAGGLESGLRWLQAVWRTSPDAAAALAAGELLTGAAVVGESSYPLAVGLPVRQVEALLADAAAGSALLPKALGEQVQSGFGEDAVARLKGVRSGNVYFGLEEARLGQVLPTVAAPPAGASATLVAPRAAGAAPVREARSVDLRPGARFAGRYSIVSVLGSGGMGVVYKARDLELDDIVALKTLRADALLDGEQLERLKSELKLARKITHPNILRTFDFGEHEGTPYLSMEYVRGLTLRQLIQQSGRVPYSAALRIARQLCAGLRAAHEVGVLHRDIKPENLILEASGNAKLMDFGIARPIRRSGPGQTEAGTYVGTPHYSAPEQLSGKEVDHRADIYAVGVLLSEMFSGGLPYAGSSTVELYMAQMQGEARPPSTFWPEIPAALEALILRCIAREPEQRYPDVAALIADLEVLRA